MSYSSKTLNLFVALCLAASSVPAQTPTQNKAPQISHVPVTTAIRGQGITLKAKVTDDHSHIEAVTLYYTLSKDAAPFDVVMKSVGLDLYLGTIEAGVLAGIHSLTYYIEAQDELGATTETPWQMIEVRDPKKGADAATPATKIAPSNTEEEGATWPYVVGGVVLIGGGAALLAGGGGGGGGGDDSGSTNPPSSAAAGTYGGSITTCATPGEGGPTCESHGMSIIIDSAGKVFSDSVREGESLNSTLSGSDFTLTASVNEPDSQLTGQIIYNGTVLGDSRIVGSIGGSAASPTGSVTYSGSFSASK
jgi:hypothetical protein